MKYKFKYLNLSIFIIIIISIVIMSTNNNIITFDNISKVDKEIKGFKSNNFSERNKVMAYSPIQISSNSEFTTNGFTGSGTSGSPYTIDGRNYESTDQYTPVVWIQDTTAYFKITNCQMYGGSYGIYLNNVENGDFTNADVYSNNAGGVRIESSSNVYFFKSSLSGTSIDNNDGAGFFIDNSADIDLISLSVHDNTDYGVKVWGTTTPSKNVYISSASIFKNNIGGVYFKDSNFGTITGTFIRDNNGKQITLNNADNNEITQNYLYDDLTTTGHISSKGIDSSYSSNNNIRSNNIYKHSSYGIQTFYGENNTIKSNNIYGNNLYNIFMSNTWNSTLYGNRMYDLTNGYGFYGSNASFSNFDNNEAYENRYGMYFKSGSKNNSLINNKLYNNDYYGLYLWSSPYNTIKNSMVYDNGKSGLYLTSNDNVIFEDNEIHSNLEHGIYNLHSDINTFYMNTIKNNTLSGLFITGSSNNNVLGNNTFQENKNLGINITETASMNVIMNNSFLDNEKINSQAEDHGTSNVFEYNYWSDWTNPDANFDGIVDNPYVIRGSANNNDNYPLADYIEPPSSSLETSTTSSSTTGSISNNSATTSTTGSISNIGATTSTTSGMLFQTIIFAGLILVLYRKRK